MTKPAYSDRLASPTMAQIFMRQGHWRRARETLDALLAHHPFAGPALALRERLAVVEAPALHARLDGDGVEARWQRVPEGAHLVVVTFAGPAVHVTSAPIGERDGRRRIPHSARWPRAALALALVRLEGGHLRVLASADPVLVAL